MLRILKRHILLGLLIIGILNFSGCAALESIEKKLGLRNDYFDYLIPNVELIYENFLDRVWCGCKLTEAEYNHLIDLNIGLFNPENDLIKEHYKKTSIKSLILEKK